MTPEQLEVSSRLEALVEKILSTEGIRDLCQDDPVNWSDLHARGVEWVVPQTGDAFYRVYVEEASPSSRNLHEFVRERLIDSGFADVEVVLEW